MSLILILALPFAGSLCAALLPSNARNAEAWLAGLTALACTVLVASLYPQVADGGVIRADLAWAPALGLQFTLRMDGFAWLFALIVSAMGALVVLYARYYMSPEDPVPRFFSFFQAFMAAMLGVVLSGNLIQLVLFWEMTSLASFMLIAYWHHRLDARRGARMALTVTGAGGLCLLAGVLILGHIVGSYDLDRVLAAGEQVRADPWYPAVVALVALGALTKSAQFPFQFWLPNAMAAPTPVSAYLHSATMVKAGVFLLARFWPVLAGTEEWFWIIGGAGLCSLVLGAYAAIFQQDMKGVLAYSTISHLGLITLLLGMNSSLGLVAAIFHMVNHATFKASLFMAAGIIDHEAGTRDMRKLSGLIRFMPFTATLAMVASAAMAGVPLLNGFLSKEMFFTETAVRDPNPFVDYSLPIVAMLAGMFSVVYSLRFIIGVFFGPPPTELDRVPHEPPALMRRPIELLVLICLLVGIIPGITIAPFLATAVHSVLGDDTPYYSLSIWHGFNAPLLMSLVAMVGGVLMYVALRSYFKQGIDGPPLIRKLKGQRIFERVLVTVSWKWARTLEGVLGTRRLQPQLFLVVAMAIIAALVPLSAGFGALGFSLDGFDPVLAMLWAIGLVCGIGAAYQAKFHRLAALILMAGAGLVTCITFVWFSAPDLALTQLVVEVVTTVLILLGLRWLPKRQPETEPRGGVATLVRRYRDLATAVIAGGGMALVSYAVMTRPLVDSIASFFLEHAYVDGGGKNVVNVILVDFRGFDTMGEITVLGIVAISVFSLLRRFRPAAESVPKPEQQLVQNAYDEARPERDAGSTIREYLTVPAVIMNWMFPVITVLAIYLFLRGHDAPGGGFAAGITMSIAFILQYMAGGTRWVEARLRVLPIRWIGSGLLVAVLTGMGSFLFGFPFLTSAFQYADVPLIGKVPMASALFFDLGVFMLVVGATVLILIALAHQSIRAPKPARVPDARPASRPIVTTAGGQ